MRTRMKRMYAMTSIQLDPLARTAIVEVVSRRVLHRSRVEDHTMRRVPD